MKKLSILLIGLLLVAGFAFGDDEFEGTPTTDVDITASVTWGVDLNTNYTGFDNAASMDVELFWLDNVDFSNDGGMDGLYGSIFLDDVELWFDGGALTLAYDYIEAKIVIDPAEIKIFAAPGFSYDQAPAVDDMNVSIALGDNDNADVNGITITVPVEPVTLGVKVASDGDWTTNAENDYAIGADVELAVDPVTLTVGFTYGFLEAATLGVSVLAELALDVVEGLDAYVGFDGVQPDGVDFDFDLAFGTTLAFSEDNDDDDSADFTLDAHVYLGDPDTDLDIAIGFAEPEAGGLMDMLYAGVTVKLLDVLEDTLGWTVDVSGGYDTGDIDPYFGFGFGSDEIVDLNVGVHLKSGFTGIDLTTITIDYTADDLTEMDATLTNDIGIITIKAEVAF